MQPPGDDAWAHNVGLFIQADWKRWRNRVVVSSAVALMIVFAALFVGIGAASSLVADSGSSAGGIFSLAPRQSVQSNLAWAFVCEAPDNTSSCVYVGGAVSIPAAQWTVITYGSGGGELGPTSYGIGEVSDRTGAWLAGVSTGECLPARPFYPGSGPIVYVSCIDRSGANASVLEFNYVLAVSVGDIPAPAGVVAIGIDPALGSLYFGLNDGEICAVNETSGAITAQVTISPPGANDTFGGAWNWISWSLEFDPIADVLLSQTGGSAVLALDPSTLAVVTQIPTGTSPWAMQVDFENGQLYVATSAGTVLAFNLTSFDAVAEISISSSPCGNGGAPFYADQMVLDSATGDLLMSGFSYCFAAVNTTTDYALPTFSLGGDGQSLLAFDPSTSVLWVIYPEDYQVGPVIVGALSFSHHPTLGSVLGLPPLLGDLLLAAVIWVPFTFFVSRGLRRRIDRHRPSTSANVGTTQEATEGTRDGPAARKE